MGVICTAGVRRANIIAAISVLVTIALVIGMFILIT